MKYFATVNGRQHEVELVEEHGRIEARVDGKKIELTYDEVDEQGQVSLQSGGRSYALSIEGGAEQLTVTLAGNFYEVALEDERERAAHAAERAGGKAGGLVKAVMPGIVVELLVRVGQSVEKGQPLLILSAMKMQNEIAAPQAGLVKELHVAAGQAVGAGAKLVTLAVEGG
jgi:glutaconyl-CoA/methylmalonyl-CoA decarboxylase subunit gamma